MHLLVIEDERALCELSLIHIWKRYRNTMTIRAQTRSIWRSVQKTRESAEERFIGI